VNARRVAGGALLVLGTVLAICACLGVWAKRQALETDNWVDTSSNLLESRPVRTALGLYLVDQLFGATDVEQRLEEVLPPRLEPLAEPAVAALRELARENAPRLLGNARALRAWRDANRAAHDRLLEVLARDEGGVSIDLRELLRQVADGTGLPEGVADRLPASVGSLEVLPPEELETARTAVKALDSAAWVLGALAVAAFAGAIALARDRRRMAAWVGVCLVLAAVGVLAARRLAGEALVGALAEAPNAQAAAADAWSIGTSLLTEAAQGLLLLGLIVATGAWLGGPGRWAVAGRRFVAPAVREYPAGSRVVLGALLLLLVYWHPVPWTGRIVPLLLLAIAAFCWLEWMRPRFTPSG
jgi:hypothetical protein